MSAGQKSPAVYQLQLNAGSRIYELIAKLSDEPAPKPEHSLAVIAELDGRIVGTITAERGWNVSNFWLERDLRGSGTAERMAREIAALNTEGLTEMLATTNEHVEVLAHRFGFVPVRGTLFRK